MTKGVRGQFQLGLLISRLRSRISRLIFSSAVVMATAGVKAMKRDQEGEGVGAASRDK